MVALFDATARAGRDRIALVAVGDGPHGDRHVSFGRLRALAESIAAALAARGIGAEHVVGVVAEHEVASVAALLGVLRAGAAFLPLDPALPVARLAAIVGTSGLRVVLTGRALPGLQSATGVELLSVEDCLGARPVPALPSSDGARAAYAIFTSGSTGAPKGVVVTHAGLANHRRAFAERIELGADEAVLQFASLAFDAAYEEIFPTLCAGARLVLRSDAMEQDVAQLVRVCEEQQIALLDVPTAYWHVFGRMLRGSGLALPAALRWVVIGGEAAQWAEVAAWREAWRGRIGLLNTYGPTEGTIIATQVDLLQLDGDLGGEVPLGESLPGTSITLRTEDGGRAALDTPGEIELAGVGVARGYLRDPRLTAARFVPVAEGPPGARAYRTGDLALRTGHGALLFRGRRDHQVKLRGHRIQLEEVERALASHPAIKACVVVMRDDRAGGQQLVAHCILDQRENAAPFATTMLRVVHLREYLRERLPAYMVPAEFSFLEKFILTSQGKVDRSKLPELGHFDRERRRLPRYQLPKPGREAQVAAIWCDVLDLDPKELGAEDPFEYIGGNSLYSIQIRQKARAAGLLFAASDMHLRQTVRGLAALCEEAPGALARARHVLADYARLGRGVLTALGRDMGARVDLARGRRVARPRAELQSFYDALPDATDVIYMFVTPNLLHWAITALRFVPVDVNLVLIGSGLADEEAEWLARHGGRPFLRLSDRIDLDTIWDLLFDINRRNFGWLDPDCFIMNPSLFTEMRRVAAGDIVNCMWTHAACGPTKRPFHVLESYFLFFNVEAIDALRRAGVLPRPSAKTATLRQVALLKQIVPADEGGEDVYRSLGGFALSHRLLDFEYARLVLFQLVANACGYKLNRVRFFTEIDTFNPYNYYSDEAIHVFPTIRDYDSIPWTGIDQKRRLASDYVLMTSMLDRLPPSYRQREVFLAGKLRELELDPTVARATIRDYLSLRGVSARTFERPEFAWLADGATGVRSAEQAPHGPALGALAAAGA